MKKIIFSLLMFTISFSAVAAEFRVALVLDKGGKDDKSFNAAAFEGASKAKKEFSSRGDRIERAGLAFHRRVLHGYHTLARRFPKPQPVLERYPGIRISFA